MTDEQTFELQRLSTDFTQYSKLKEFVEKVIGGLAQIEKVENPEPFSPTDSIIFESETYRDKIYPSERKRIRIPAIIANGQEIHPERYEYLSLVCRPSEMRTD
jgi:hypothetical protein